MVSGIHRNILLPWSWAVLWNEHCLPRYCTEQKRSCWTANQPATDSQCQKMRFFLDCKLAKLLPPPPSPRPWHILQKTSVSAGGLQKWYWQSPGMEQKLLCSPRSNEDLPIRHCLEGCTCSGYKGIPAYSHTDAEFPGHPPAPHQPYYELLCLDPSYPVCINQYINQSINQSHAFRISPKFAVSQTQPLFLWPGLCDQNRAAF